MKNSTTIVIALIISMFTAISGICQQTTFVKVGTIEYERKQNLVAAFSNDPHMQMFVEKNGSEIYTSYFTLTINENFSLYQFSKANGQLNQFSEMPADNNLIYRELNANKKIVQKNVNGKLYSLSDDDSLLIQWKLTDERKMIAGFDCRRANALILDSIYVVAFFADQFASKSGPESFAGLPGLILGVSIPHEHISWFATKVNIADKPIVITAPKGGLQISTDKFQELVKTQIFGIPKYGPFLYIRALL